MQHLNYSNLHTIGVEPLTGEACAYSMRTLCDLNEDGCELIADFFGMRPYVRKPQPLDHMATETMIAAYKRQLAEHEHSLSLFGERWNSMVGDKPAVASVMLSQELMPALARFALFRKGYRYVAGVPEGVYYTAFNGDDQGEGSEYLRMLQDGTASAIQSGAVRLYRNHAGSGGQPVVGSRNLHAFSGRAA